jgi:hypothetical protein
MLCTTLLNAEPHKRTSGVASKDAPPLAGRHQVGAVPVVAADQREGERWVDDHRLRPTGKAAVLVCLV